MTKLWHDDCRPPPEGWVWVKTNDQAKAVLENGWPIVECSLDFDLGLHGVELPGDPDEFITVLQDIGPSAEDGADLVRWMIENKYVPPNIIIHSWNPAGTKLMSDLFNDAGYSVVARPFKTLEALRS